MNTLWQDLRYGARMLMKNSGFTLVAVFTLALGIGANTTIFSMLNTLFWKPLPGIADHERIVQIGRTSNGRGFESVSYADYRDYRDQNSTFAGIAAESEQQFHFGSDKTAERIKGALVTGNYFDVFGVRVAQGRLLRRDEAEIEGANPIAVISERLWRDQFGAEDVVGKTISLNSYPYTVIGVAAEFKGSLPMGEKADVWIRSEEHTSELQSLRHLVCRLLLEKKKITKELLQPSRKKGRKGLGPTCGKTRKGANTSERFSPSRVARRG